MSNMEASWLGLRQLDEMASQQTVIHRINPCAKLVTTIVFIIVVASFPKYEVSSLLPLFFYPMVLMILGNLSLPLILKRVLLAMPFVLCIGIFNPLVDQVPVVQIGSYLISGGWVSFASIFLRFLLAVTGALILVGTTGIDGIGMALLKIKVPSVFVMQLLFMYRYLYVLVEEFIRTIRAYSLRSFHGTSLQYKVWGALLGQLLLRTIDRGGRIYQAMLCRGFQGEIRLSGQRNFNSTDKIYILWWSAFFILVRYVNIPQWLGNLLMGGN